MMTLVSDIPAESTGSSTERRRGLRIEQNRPVKILDPSAARFFGGQTRDVSATGLCIEMPATAPVRAGKIVSIHVGLSQSGEPLANRRNMIPARVVWVRREAAGSASSLCAGVEFLASIAHLDAA
jgi:hypothetical protein